MTCLACQQASDATICHACQILFERAQDGFLATPDYPSGIVVGVASSSIEEHNMAWPTLSSEVQDRLRPKFMAVLEQALDIQSQTIREYAEARGLTLHDIVREITQRATKRVAAKEVLADLQPGDHLILFGHASGAMSRGGHPIMATCSISVKCAQRGIRLHIASLGLDLSKPLGQYVLRLAQQSFNFWTPSQVLHRDKGDLFGLNEGLARWDARVRWVVRGVRSGLSPAELAVRAKDMYAVTYVIEKSSFALAVTDGKQAHADVVPSALWFCIACGSPCTHRLCRCGKRGTRLGQDRTVKGIRFPECGHMPVDQQLMACWNFHRRMNPGQDEERPWETKKSA